MSEGENKMIGENTLEDCMDINQDLKVGNLSAVITKLNDIYIKVHEEHKGDTEEDIYKESIFRTACYFKAYNAEKTKYRGT